MTSSKPVPKLDLAPKLNRPLSLWNPLDYLRLLYWCFYFPQALRWYEENYGGGDSFAKQTSWQKRLEFLRQHPDQLKLSIQGLLLTVIVPLAVCTLLGQIGFDIYWFRVAGGAAVSVLIGVTGGISGGVMYGVAGGVGFGVTAGMMYGVTFGVGFTMTGGMADGVALGVGFGVAVSVFVGVALSVMFGVVGSIGYGVALGVGFGVAGGVANGVGYGIAFCVANGVAIFRPENWLIYSPLNLQKFQNSSWLFPRITPIPLPLLELRIKKWLRQDWQTGLENANELLKYSLQFIPVVKAVIQVLAEIPSEQLIFRVSQLAENPYDWKLMKFASASFNLYEQPRLDTPPQATAVGFWYLHEKQPHQATEAFRVVRNLLYGEEMYVLADTLTLFQAAKNPVAIAEIQLPSFPSQNLLRPTTWDALNGFRRVVEDIKLVLNGTSKSARSFALNRAIGELKTIQDNKDIIPKAEQGLIVDIAETWITALEGIALDIGNIAITEPIQNPYVIGDPVEGSLFVGREEIMRQFKEMSPQLQSVVLFGHRRMGKTSILRNLSHHLGTDITVVYINLQGLGSVSEGMGEVLMAICDGISDAIQIPPPADEALLKIPQRTFERYLKKVVDEMPQQGLIIALDEFEMIEELIEAKQIPTNFIGVLRSWVQLYSNVAFVFAGLHTLEEMTADYFNPLFGSVINIRVGFLNSVATRQVLTSPNDDFLLNYTGEALDLIYQLTSGQPYLVQLIGFLLVRRYNDQVFELGRSRDSTLTIEDVEAVINHSEVFSQGRYYFTGVWQQAAEGCIGQQEILKALAANYQGLTINHLSEVTGLDETIINEALETLKRHDVVKQSKLGWKIVVELFRRWVNEIGKK